MKPLAPKTRTLMIAEKCAELMEGPYAKEGLTVSAAFAAIRDEGGALSDATTRLMVANVLRDMLRDGEAEARKSVPHAGGWTRFVPVRYWLKGMMPKKKASK